MDFVSLDTEDEQDNFLTLCNKKPNLFESWTHIGGIALMDKSKDFWFWVNSGKLDYSLKFAKNEPDNYQNVQHCLCIGKRNLSNFMFYDISCNSENDDKSGYKFVCERKNNPEKVEATIICHSSCCK